LSLAKGRIAEQKAIEFLNKNGFLVIEKNFYASKFGEIDIIATKDGTLHFVEVKSGNNGIYNITTSKLNKIINSANYYLKTKSIDMNFWIDAIIINHEQIDFIENITL